MVVPLQPTAAERESVEPKPDLQHQPHFSHCKSPLLLVSTAEASTQREICRATTGMCTCYAMPTHVQSTRVAPMTWHTVCERIAERLQEEPAPRGAGDQWGRSPLFCDAREMTRVDQEGSRLHPSLHDRGPHDQERGPQLGTQVETHARRHGVRQGSHVRSGTRLNVDHPLLANQTTTGQASRSSCSQQRSRHGQVRAKHAAGDQGLLFAGRVPVAGFDTPSRSLQPIRSARPRTGVVELCVELAAAACVRSRGGHTKKTRSISHRFPTVGAATTTTLLLLLLVVEWAGNATT